MIYLKVKGTKSWLDPRSQKGLAFNLHRRLWSRCHGHRGLCLTLTYRRDEYRDPLDLYRMQSEQQHVPLFLRKLSRHLKRTGGLPDGGLKGRWFCKMEFQKGGWVHFHIIVLDVPKVPHAELTAMWGHGHVWVKRLNQRAVKYCCKYLSKGGRPPAFLLGEPPKAVKVVRVSPGFWGDTPPRPKREPDPMDEYDAVCKVRMYVPIGQKIDDASNQCIVHDDQGRYVTLKDVDFGPLLAALILSGYGVTGGGQGWLAVDMADVGELDHWMRSASRRGVVDSLRSKADHDAAAKPPLHLIRGRNRDAGCPGWLADLLAERFSPQWMAGAA